MAQDETLEVVFDSLSCIKSCYCCWKGEGWEMPALYWAVWGRADPLGRASQAQSQG